MKQLIPVTAATIGIVFLSITPVAAQTTKNAPPALPPGPSIGSLLGPFLIVIVFGALAFLFRRFVGRRSSFQGKGQIDVLAARQVAPHRSVQVIQVGGKNYLIGVGENIQLLSELPDDLASLQTPQMSQTKLDFQQLLTEYSRRLWKKR